MPADLDPKPPMPTWVKLFIALGIAFAQPLHRFHDQKDDDREHDQPVQRRTDHFSAREPVRMLETGRPACQPRDRSWF